MPYYSKHTGAQVDSAVDKIIGLLYGSLTEAEKKAIGANIDLADNAQLTAELNRLAKTYAFGGVATPSTNPGTPTTNTFYIASESGIYSKMGNITLVATETAIIAWNGASWVKHTIDIPLPMPSTNGFSAAKVGNGVMVFDTKFAEAGDSLDYSFELTGVSGNIAFMNEDGTRISTVGVGNGTAGRIISGTVAVPAGFSYAITQWGAIANVKLINKTKNVALSNIEKTAKCVGAGFAQGVLQYESTTGLLSAPELTDIFTGSGTGKFFRFYGGHEFCTFNVTGSSVLVFNPTTSTMAVGGNVEGAIVAYILANKIYPIGHVKVRYTTNGVVTSEVSFPKDEPDTRLEEYVKTSAITTFSRLNDWADSGDVHLCGFVTDIHSSGNKKYDHLLYMSQLNNMFGFNEVCMGGDIGFDLEPSAQKSAELVAKAKAAMLQDVLWVFCKGNHDYITAINGQYLGNVFNRATRRAGHKVELCTTNGSYGYVDDEYNKVRTIFLNTSDAESGAYIVSTDQLSWLITALGGTPSSYRVIILTHFCPAETVGKWSSSPSSSYTTQNFVALRGIFESFVAKNSGSNSSLGLSWDFSSLTAKLVCVMSGDSHFNNMGVVNGVRYIVRQGYGYPAESDRPSSATYDAVDYFTQCLFDVLAIRADNTARIFRIGVGGSARDEDFTF